ncbi:Retinol dehydrogenase 13 [Cytospora mali]|uniref:Retinol dehydrogenase 13 n=1 Tax=Cytospora mali TaxID=578113 RepID=A0A194UXA0_CYTMA|nr:Retinol dehydrogenase 13 [Valsa mali var. pyri (nom. inval.)]
MANIAAKTVVATGASSGLGFELVKQLLAQAEPYRFILGARDTETTKKAYDELKFDSATHSVTVLPLELSNLKDVKSFSQQTLQNLGQDKLDYLLLNAGVAKGAEGPGPYGSKWCEPYIVNHLSEFDKTFLAGSGLGPIDTYSVTKFVQLLGAHWWRRQLPQCDVVAVSPGLIPQTGLPRHGAMPMNASMPDAKSVPEGAQSILRAFTRSDFPSDPDQIFLTSWGEWWGKDVYEKTLDKKLQDKWCPSKEDIEQTEGIVE